MFDMVIHLNQKQLPRRLENPDIASTTNPVGYGKSADMERFPVTDFDPAALLLEELNVCISVYLLDR